MPYPSILDTVPVIMANPDGSYGGNLPVKFTQSLQFSYLLTQGDYFTGSYQFLKIVRLTLDPAIPGSRIGFAESNPRRYDYGEYSVTGQDGYVHERGKIDASKWCWRRLSEPYPLSRNEAARPKLHVLAQRIRATFQTTFLNLPAITGKVEPVNTRLNATTNLVVVPNSGTTVGDITPLSTGSAAIEIPAGSLKFHSTDSNIQLMDVSPTTTYQPLTPNPFGNDPDIQDYNFNVYLNPGVVGSCSYSVFRCGEQAATHPNVGTPYLPNTLP